MTNKPMLSVERELLERAVNGHRVEHRDAMAELRMMLRDCIDKPAAHHQGEPVAWVECSPAWLKAGGDCATAPRICVGREGISHLHPAHSIAEQPAPLKIGSGVTVQNIGFGSEKERKPYLVFDSDGCLTKVNLIDVSLVSKRKVHTIADLEAIGVRVDQAAPVAVVMPERMTLRSSDGYETYETKSWNAALDAVARLNGALKV